MTITSTLEFDLSERFETRLRKLIKICSPGTETVEIMDFGLEDDINGICYRRELVISLDDDEIFISEKRTDLDIFHWYNNAGINQVSEKYVKDTILEMIENNKEDFGYEEDED